MSSDSFLQVNDDSIAFLLADSFSEIRFHGQLMSAVSQSHERAAEWMAVDGAANLDQTSSAEECSRVRHHDVGPASFGGGLLQMCLEALI